MSPQVVVIQILYCTVFTLKNHFGLHLLVVIVLVCIADKHCKFRLLCTKTFNFAYLLGR